MESSHLMRSVRQRAVWTAAFLLYVPALAGGQAISTPSWPADVVYKSDKTYHIAPDGTDRLSDGSAARPFATLKRALEQVRIDRAGPNPPGRTEISLRADGTYAPGQFLEENGLLIDSYGASSPEQRAVIISSDVGLGSLKIHDLHLQNLRISADPKAGGSYGIYIASGDDISMDYCEVDGFNMNVDLIGAATHVRLHHNFIANAYTAKKATMSCSGLYTECDAPDVQCNVFYHNGWRAPFDLNDPDLIRTMMFRHGWYENPGNGSSVAGIDRYNLYLRNACTGHQCRTGGGAVLWDVFWDNGNAADVFTGPGIRHNLGGEIGHCVFFGNLTRDFACWGGGAMGESVADNFHDLLFSGSSTMQLPPAITLHWGNGNGPRPANASASIANCRGIWAAGDVLLLDGRAAATADVRIRKPVAGEHVPTLLDYCNTSDDASTAQLLRTHLHDAKYSAQSIIAWADKSIPDK